MSFCCAACKDFEQQTYLEGRCRLTNTRIKDSSDPNESCGLGKPTIISDGFGSICEVSISSVRSSAFVMRELDESVISDLVLNIKERGLLQPIMVRRIEKDYEIVFGRHRLEACKRLGYERIAAIVKEYSEEEAIFIQIIENIQRNSKEGIIQQGTFYAALNKKGLSTRDIGKKIGKSGVYISDCISVAVKLHPTLRPLIVQKKISPSMAHRIAELNPERQLEVAQRAVEENWRVRDFELNCRQRVIHNCHCLTCPVHGPMLSAKRKMPPLKELYFAGTWIRRRSNVELDECVYCGHVSEVGEYEFPLKWKGSLTSYVSCQGCAIPRLPEEFVKLFGHYNLSDPFLRKTGLQLSVISHTKHSEAIFGGVGKKPEYSDARHVQHRNHAREVRAKAMLPTSQELPST
jgi:ParB/RepB/Spo0J family partition protein